MDFCRRSAISKKHRLLLAIACFLVAGFAAGCSDSNTNVFQERPDDNGGNGTADTTAPAVSGTPAATTVTPFSIAIAWTAATDDTSEASALSYKVVRAAAAADIDTVAEADAVTGDGLVMDWTEGSTSAVQSFLLSDTTYHFAVLVRDEAGNTALYDPAAIDTPAIGYPKVTHLTNGNLLLVYKDVDDGLGKSVVYDEAGNPVAGPTTIAAGGIQNGLFTEIALITHGTGVPVASYVSNADGKGYYVVLDNDGEIALGPTNYLDEAAFCNGALAGGSGNSLFLATGRLDYFAAGQQGGGYAIHDVSDGSVVKAITEFNYGGGHDETRGVAASAIGADRFLFVYSQDWEELTPIYVVYDETGTVQAEEAFATTKADTFRIRKLANNNAIVAYVDLVGAGNKGKFVIYQSTGAEAVGATTFADVALNNGWLALTLTSGGNALIAYSDSTDDNKAKYVVYDSAGAPVAAADISETGEFPCAAATLADGTIALVNRTEDNVYKLRLLAGL